MSNDHIRKIAGFFAVLTIFSLLLVACAPSAVSEAAQGTTMDEVAKGRVGVLLGTVYDTYLVKNYPSTQVLQYKNYPDLILAVQSGKVDSGFINCQAFKELQKENPFLTLLVGDVFSNPVGVGFSQENDPLRGEFNKFLTEIKSNGVYDDWHRRWFQDGNYEMPVIENTKANGEVVIGIVSDNLTIGFCILNYRHFIIENTKANG
ncbi:MAG TPA: transporter substrate-binding domain-containing protein, partial [Saprospiraceae bacterium]|nr:transporter substrate-binding domain-containing protein [Saprospiraceae bacterium]